MTKRGLNIGAGRAQFPVTDENRKYSDHLAHALMHVPEAYDKDVEWVNIDRAALPGIDAIVNVFRYPWVDENNNKPLADSQFDVVFCSHIIEHIPHDIRLSEFYVNHPDNYFFDMYSKDMDGWFAFFGQVWRLLKPGGLMHIVAPYGWSYSGMSDPTHTRYILPSSFSYFVPNPDAPFDYQIPFRFDQVTPDGMPEGNITFRFVNQSLNYTQKMEEVEAFLKAYPDHPEREKALADKDLLYRSLDAHVTQHINQIEDMYVVFRAAK